jgi:co-chaperonin GroES (HSP10)
MNDEGIDLENFSKEEEIAKFSGLEAVGWTIIVRLYVEPQSTKSGIFIPAKAHEEQQYKGCVGLVVKKGKGTYLDDRYAQTGHWCEVGDWVGFPRHAGYRIYHNGTPLWVLKEDGIDYRTDDPRKISR